MDASKRLLCASCSGARMVLGQPQAWSEILHAGYGLFRLQGKPALTGFQIYPVACLDCGYVGTCLSEDELPALAKKVSGPPRAHS